MSDAYITEITQKCKAFVVEHWGKDGLDRIKNRPVSWVRHEANPHLMQLRRRQKGGRGMRLPLIAVQADSHRVRLALSNE